MSVNAKVFEGESVTGSRSKFFAALMTLETLRQGLQAVFFGILF